MKDKFKQYEVENILKLLGKKQEEQLEKLKYRTRDQVIELAEQHGYEISEIEQILSERKYTRAYQIKDGIKNNLAHTLVAGIGIGIGYKLYNSLTGSEGIENIPPEVATLALLAASIVTVVSWCATRKRKSLERLISEIKVFPGRAIGAAAAVYVANLI